MFLWDCGQAWVNAEGDEWKPPHSPHPFHSQGRALRHLPSAPGERRGAEGHPPERAHSSTQASRLCPLCLHLRATPAFPGHTLALSSSHGTAALMPLPPTSCAEEQVSGGSSLLPRGTGFRGLQETGAREGRRGMLGSPEQQPKDSGTEHEKQCREGQ